MEIELMIFKVLVWDVSCNYTQVLRILGYLGRFLSCGV